MTADAMVVELEEALPEFSSSIFLFHKRLSTVTTVVSLNWKRHSSILLVPDLKTSRLLVELIYNLQEGVK